MGCVYSHSRGSTPEPKSFNVMNVDDRGNEINSGVIQITESDLILKQGDSFIRWPLRSLRRYGFDAQLFSFECGRRCPTGPGIYAFRCSEAEELFNLLQEAINNSSIVPINGAVICDRSNSLIPYNVHGESDVNDPASGRNSNLLPPEVSPSHAYANTIHNYINSPIYNDRLTNGETMPPSTSGNMRPVASHSLPTTGVTDINTNYAKIDDLVRYYVNINTPAFVASGNQSSIEMTETRRSSHVVSDEGNQMESPTILEPPTTSEKISSTPPSTPATPVDKLPVNYIMLDLADSAPNSVTSQHFVTTAPPTPVTKTPKQGEMSWTPPATPDRTVGQKYALIDFEKTEALTSAAFQRKNN